MYIFPETMIQLAHTSSGIRRSHSVESQKFKSKFLQCSPKDWPAPSKGWTCCFYNFFSAEDDLDFEDPPSFLTSQIERIFWWAAISSFSALTFSTLKVYVRQSSEDNQGQTTKEGLKFSNVPWYLILEINLIFIRYSFASTRGSVLLPVMTTQAQQRAS